MSDKKVPGHGHYQFFCLCRLHQVTCFYIPSRQKNYFMKVSMMLYAVVVCHIDNNVNEISDKIDWLIGENEVRK